MRLIEAIPYMFTGEIERLVCPATSPGQRTLTAVVEDDAVVFKYTLCDEGVKEEKETPHQIILAEDMGDDWVPVYSKTTLSPNRVIQGFKEEYKRFPVLLGIEGMFSGKLTSIKKEEGDTVILYTQVPHYESDFMEELVSWVDGIPNVPVVITRELLQPWVVWKFYEGEEPK